MRAVGWLVLVCLTGCGGSEPERLLSHTSHPLEAGMVLDLRGDVPLVGTRLPAVDHADPALEIRLDGVAVPTSLRGAVVSHALALADDQTAVHWPDGRLTLIGPDGAESLVANQVRGPLGRSADGQRLVWTQGYAPDTEVYARDQTGAVRAVTHDMAPAWSPAISNDGETVLFVSARTGVPAVWSIRGQRSRQLTNVGAAPDALAPFPVGITGPRLAQDRLVFQHGDALHILDLDGVLQGQLTGAQWPVHSGEGAAAWMDGVRLRVVP